jgi:uncharacterized protein YndB with AHSA1/START domain
MTSPLILKKTVKINASPAKVWEALTNPEVIKKYFFGTECITDWKKGSPILYKGTWEGKPYEDKGNILNIETEKLIHYNYWSSFSGTEDIPENYAEIKYELEAEADGTIFTIIQDGFKNKEAVDHSETNWGYILDGLKKITEEE